MITMLADARYLGNTAQNEVHQRSYKIQHIHNLQIEEHQNT